MPSYAGGKAKIGKSIAEIIKQYSDEYMSADKQKKVKIYIPFAGLLGVSRHLIDYNFEIYANDANNDIISMWEMLKNKEYVLPEHALTKDEYIHMKQTNSGEPHERGFYSIACAYSGIPFAGYRVISNGRNYYDRTKRGINEIVENGILNSIIFSCKDYELFLENCENTIIYADPPYKNNKFNAKYFKDFDSERFWNVMRRLAVNNLVIISEYEAPADFKCIWEKQYYNVFSSKLKRGSEKLFVFDNNNLQHPLQ